MRPLGPGCLAACVLLGVVLLPLPVSAVEPRGLPAKHQAQKPTPKKVAQQGKAQKPARGTAAPRKKPAKKPLESKKAPKKPGSEPRQPEPQARASIAGRPVVAPISSGASESPELDELREVEDILFWDIERVPALAPGSAKPEVLNSGLPPAVSSGAVDPPPSSAESSELRWMAQLAKPDLPFRWDVRLIRYLDYFKNNPRGRSFVQSLLKRSGRYEAKMRELLRARKLPEDLVYLALVESGMNPRIVSHAGAAGLWQFMPKAATAYGLRIDKHVDERLDPQRSTEAAMRFLQDLHARFGRWELAMAAYNMGHGGLLTSIRKYNTNDFWELSQLEAGIPFETALYVPKIVAIAFVARNKEVFGCTDLQLDPAEKLVVDATPPPPAPGKLESVASAKKPVTTVVAPATTPALPVDVAPVEVEGKGRDQSQTLLVDSPPVKYTLRWGESLEYVASTVGTTESRLRALNALTNPVPPRPGTVILVPRSGAKPAQLDQPVAVVPARTSPVAGKKRVFYEVVWGDDLSDVARTLGVTADDLCHWNNLDRSANLHGKMVLQAFVAEDRSLSDVRTIASKDARVLVVGSPEFFDHFEAKNGRVRSVVTVNDGDTMQSLAKKFGISVGMMERINHRSRDSVLKRGETLIVYGRKAIAPGVLAPKKGASDTIYDSEESNIDG